MTNAEKFKTAEERAKAFDKWCEARGCEKCKLRTIHLNAMTGSVCTIAWLDMEAEEEKSLPCPYCGGETWVRDYVPANERVYDILCHGCEYRSQKFYSRKHAIAAHNRVARAVMQAGVKEEK